MTKKTEHECKCSWAFCWLLYSDAIWPAFSMLLVFLPITEFSGSSIKHNWEEPNVSGDYSGPDLHTKVTHKHKMVVVCCTGLWASTLPLWGFYFQALNNSGALLCIFSCLSPSFLWEHWYLPVCTIPILVSMYFLYTPYFSSY